MAMADDNGNNSTMIPEEDRLGVVLPRYLAGYVDTISQAVQRIAGHMTTGVAQFPNIISIVPLQVFGHVANELASGLQLQIANNNSVLQLQGTGNDDHTIQMPPNQDSASMDQPTQQLARDIWKISVPTLVIAIGTALYKPASGVLFRHHPLAYYCGLAAIFVAGVGETLTAYWLACSRDANGHHFTIGKAVWWASIVPLIFVLGIGGCHVIVGY